MPVPGLLEPLGWATPLRLAAVQQVHESEAGTYLAHVPHAPASRAGDPCWITVGRLAGPDEQHAIQIEGMCCLSRHQKVDVMNRIEGPPRTARRLGPLAVTVETVRAATRPVKTMA